jgi:hypothetical protein
MAKREIKRMDDLKSSIRTAKNIYVLPRFGAVSEHWLRVTKAEARDMFKESNRYETPADWEMSTDIFGTVDENGDVWLG